jgi:hypothetical protein
LFNTAVSISAITAGINLPPNNKLKNHLLDVLGLFKAIFSNSKKRLSIEVESFLIFMSISFEIVCGDLYFSTGTF